MSNAVKEKQAFPMFNSFIDAAANLDNAHFKECILKIRDYALYGENNRSEHIGVNIILDMAKPVLDAAKKRYERCVENGKKGGEHGKKGGRPKKENKPQEKPQSHPLNENDNGYDNDNDDEYAYGKEYVDEKDKTTISTEHETEAPSVNPNQITVGKQNASQQSLSETNPIYLEDSVCCFSHNPSSGYYQPNNQAKDECLRYLFETKEPNVADMADEMKRSICKALKKLVAMEKGQYPKDSSVFFNAVENYKALYGFDEKRAIKDINTLKSQAKRLIEAHN